MTLRAIDDGPPHYTYAMVRLASAWFSTYACDGEVALIMDLRRLRDALCTCAPGTVSIAVSGDGFVHLTSRVGGGRHRSARGLLTARLPQKTSWLAWWCTRRRTRT
jgi:hypothetical protein